MSTCTKFHQSFAVCIKTDLFFLTTPARLIWCFLVHLIKEYCQYFIFAATLKYRATSYNHNYVSVVSFQWWQALLYFTVVKKHCRPFLSSLLSQSSAFCYPITCPFLQIALQMYLKAKSKQKSLQNLIDILLHCKSYLLLPCLSSDNTMSTWDTLL